MKYYRHKEKYEVVCEVLNETARFGKWVWNGNTCSEVYTHKEVTTEFKSTFEEITQKPFNYVWGKKLREA
jgi:hypothetical protein